MRRNDGDFLLNLADTVRRPHRRIVTAEGMGDTALTAAAHVALALKLQDHPVLALRAVMEDWDLETIVREVY